ncbi:MAG: AbrB/MazE/SpoVT family DNA-binding domain-containing protein [Candidatus Asgardarchaeia archaeon]
MNTEIKKVDKRGRIILPAKWRKKALDESRLVLLIEEGNELKIIPFKKTDLTKYFDKLDFGVDEIINWKDFELRFYKGVER